VKTLVPPRPHGGEGRGEGASHTPRPTPRRHPSACSPRVLHTSNLFLTLLILLSLLLPNLFAAHCQPSQPSPFLQFRQQSLQYHGPERPPPHPSKALIVWFAPYLEADPQHDAWWSAQLAVQHAQLDPASRALAIELIPCWADDPWGSGAAQLARLVFDRKPVALLGSIDSATTHLAEQITTKAHLPLISPVATDKTATLAGVSWMFACPPSDLDVAQLLAHALLEHLPNSAAPIALLATTDHDSRMLARELFQLFSRAGRLPNHRYTFPPGVGNPATQLDALEAAQPHSVLLIAPPDDAATLLRQIRQRLPHTLVYGGPSFGRHTFLQLAGTAAESVRFPLLFSPKPNHPITARFQKEFQNHFGRPPDYVNALTYDATRLLLYALHQAGPEPKALRQALSDLSPWCGITGPVQFDGTGQNHRTNLPLGTIINATLQPLAQ
jgi:branched-chain amino acid transport system substrate-binding protein